MMHPRIVLAGLSGFLWGLGSFPSLVFACPPPIMSRLLTYRWQAGDTINTVAQRHQLQAATLLGLNPRLRSGPPSLNTEIFIPPLDGALIQPGPGETLQAIGQRYGVKPDVLFEVNGCQAQPNPVFIPGVAWSPQGIVRLQSPTSWQTSPLQGLPLRNAIKPASVSTGVRFSVNSPQSVLAAASGTVAFVGERAGYGQLVVINHPQGWQTRYSSLSAIQVKAGESVATGTVLGQTNSPVLGFELRQNTPQGWLARDPLPFLQPFLPSLLPNL